jgi:hypothetical protein
VVGVKLLMVLIVDVVLKKEVNLNAILITELGFFKILHVFLLPQLLLLRQLLLLHLVHLVAYVTVYTKAVVGVW